MDEELKKVVLNRLKSLSEFIRKMEDFAASCNMNIDDEKLYIAACAQRKILNELLER